MSPGRDLGRDCGLLYGGRFAQVLSAVSLSAAGKAIEFRVTAYLGNFIVQPFTSQHAEMSMMVGAAAARSCDGHCVFLRKLFRQLKAAATISEQREKENSLHVGQSAGEQKKSMVR